MNGIHPPSDTIWPFGNHSPELPAELLAEAVRLFGLSKGGACGKNIQLKSLRKDMPETSKQNSCKSAFCHDFEGKQDFYGKKTSVLEAFVRIRPRCCHSRCHCCRCWCCRCRRCGLGRRRRRLGRRLWLSRSLASTGADIKNPSFRGFVLEHRTKKWDHFLGLEQNWGFSGAAVRTLLRTFFAAGFGAGAFAVAALGLQSGDPGRVEDQPNLMEINLSDVVPDFTGRYISYICCLYMCFKAEKSLQKKLLGDITWCYCNLKLPKTAAFPFARFSKAFSPNRSNSRFQIHILTWIKFGLWRQARWGVWYASPDAYTIIFLIHTIPFKEKDSNLNSWLSRT